MREIVICNQALSPSSFYGQCSVEIDQISAIDCTTPSMVAANTLTWSTKTNQPS